MSTLYIAIVLLVNIVFFGMYVFITNKQTVSGFSVIAIGLMCVASVALSIAIPAIYVFKELYLQIIIKLLFIILLSILAIGGLSLMHNKKDDAGKMMKDFFSKAVVFLFETKKKLSRKSQRIFGLKQRTSNWDDVLSDYTEEFGDGGVFKFILSNAQNDVKNQQSLPIEEDKQSETLEDGILQEIDVSLKDVLQSEVNSQEQTVHQQLVKETAKGIDTINVKEILQEIVQTQEEQVLLMADEIQQEIHNEIETIQCDENVCALEDEQLGMSDKEDKNAGDIYSNGDEVEDKSAQEGMNLAVKDDTHQKFVDSTENIDKMRLENCCEQELCPQNEVEKYGDIVCSLDADDLSIEQCIERAFSYKEKGDLEPAILHYLYVLDKHLPKDLALMVLLDVCALYKEMGDSEIAKSTIEGYISKFSEMLDIGQREEIEKNLE